MLDNPWSPAAPAWPKHRGEQVVSLKQAMSTQEMEMDGPRRAEMSARFAPTSADWGQNPNWSWTSYCVCTHFHGTIVLS